MTWRRVQLFARARPIAANTGFGIAFGLLFPIVAIAIEEMRAPAPLHEKFVNNPVLGIVALAPLVLGAVFLLVGRIQAKLQSKVTSLRHAERKNWRLANIDPLTGQGNRRRLLAKLAALRHDAPVPWLLLIDLDRFKFINDTLGHDVGDELLRQFSARVAAVLAPQEKLFRLGGDEFVVVDFAGRPDPETLAAAVLDVFKTPFETLGVQVTSAASIGIARPEPTDETASPALARADLALYQAKARSGERFVRFEPRMAESARDRASMEQAIRDGLARGEFHVEYQPIVDARSGILVSFEALLRWRHPERGALSPGVFVPIAERSSLILALGEFVLHQACAQAVGWPGEIGVAVNVSARQLRHPEFEHTIMSALEESGLTPDRLTLEITESMLIDNLEAVAAMIARIRGRGVRVALDDFGTGFSSINHLRAMKLDYLKIDRSFVQRLASDPSEAGVIRSVIDLSHQFGLTTVAEGVEALDERLLLRDLGADRIQGFFFGRAMAAEKARAFALRQAADHDEARLPVPQPSALLRAPPFRAAGGGPISS